MTDQHFWTIIDECVTVNDDGGIDATALCDHLVKLEADEILAFAEISSRHFAESRTRDLWGAACIIHDGAPDDTFDYFRSWLIGRGSKIFANAITDPDSLVDVATVEALDDSVYGAGQFAYEAATGNEFPGFQTPWPDLDGPIDFDGDELLSRYPRLAKKFGDYYRE
ncbi:MAG: DUF4240 domain-containing protein [Planctomycetota bacterium]